MQKYFYFFLCFFPNLIFFRLNGFVTCFFSVYTWLYVLFSRSKSKSMVQWFNDKMCQIFLRNLINLEIKFDHSFWQVTCICVDVVICFWTWSNDSSGVFAWLMISLFDTNLDHMVITRYRIDQTVISYSKSLLD